MMRNSASVRNDAAVALSAPAAPVAKAAAPPPSTRAPVMQRAGALPPPLPKPRVAGRYVASKPEPWTSRWVKRPVVAGLAHLANLVRHRFSAGLQVTAPPWVTTMEPHEPLFWLSTHQTSLDFISVFALEARLPNLPDLRIASRTYGNDLRGRILTFIAKPFVFHLNRPAMGEGTTPTEVARLRAENEEQFRRVRAHFAWGAHAMAFPEGTTMTDGGVAYIKNGTFTIAFTTNADGSISYVPMVPVSNTIDLLAAPKGKSLTFINIGERLAYEPAAPLPGESAEAYHKRDMKIIAEHVHDELVRLSTVTPSQIIGTYLMAKVERGDTRATRHELQDVLIRQARALAALGLSIDEKLGTFMGCLERFADLWPNLLRLGYLAVDGDTVTINAARVNHQAIDTSYVERDPRRFRKYRKENPLRYCANRLLQVAQSNPQVRAVLATRGYQ